MNVQTQPYARLATLEAKFVSLYFSALVAASLSEIEACRSDWGCEPLRGATVVLEGATPMLIVLLFTPITRRGLAGISFAIFGSMLWLRLYTVRPGGIDSLGNILALWTFGTCCAVAVFVISKGFYDRRQIQSFPPPVLESTQAESMYTRQTVNTSVPSRKRTMILLCTGVGVGTLLGQIEIYRIVDTWSFNLSTFKYYSFLAGCTVAPIIIISWNSELKKNSAIILSIVVGILILICNILFAHEVFANIEWTTHRARLGFVYLWLGNLLVASVIFVYRKLSSRVDCT